MEGINTENDHGIIKNSGLLEIMYHVSEADYWRDTLSCLFQDNRYYNQRFLVVQNDSTVFIKEPFRETIDRSL
jgi:hypothetical protein